MNLYEIEEERKRKENEKKLNKNMLKLIISTIVIIIVLIIGIKYLKNNPTDITVSIDGNVDDNLLSILEVEEDDDGEISISAPIRKLATYLGYENANGTPEATTENVDNCYAKNENELVTFSVDSNIIYKLDQTVENAEYEYYTLNGNVFKQNNELYLDIEGLGKAFNFTYEYSQKEKRIYIYTLDIWVSSASKIAENKGYECDDTFSNQKAILDGLIVVTKGNDSSKEYGIIEYSTGDEKLSVQYESIIYIPQQSAFFISKNGKVGISSVDFETNSIVEKISGSYETLTLIDNDLELYLVSNNGLYGVIDGNENQIIYTEYDKIGIDITNFAKNDVKTGYILLDTLIPVQQSGKWGFFDVNGNKVTNIEYDDIGSISENRTSLQSNLLLIKDYEVIVVKKNERYGFINVAGKEVISFVLDDVYMQVSGGNIEYYMIRSDNQKTYEVTEILENQGVTKVTE